MRKDYALIVGIDDYRTYDGTGASNVPGAVDDARTLCRQYLAMGFPPERIRVLTSPRLPPAAFGLEGTAAHVGEATGEAIVAGLSWIVRALADHERAAGLVTFTGHGLLDPGIVLCPSDFDGEAERLVQLSDVVRRVAPGEEPRNLTVLLDCNHAVRSESRGATDVPGRLAALIAESERREHWMPECAIAASAGGRPSASTRFGSETMGAFTWAVTSVLGQLEASERGCHERADVTCGQILSRTKALLEALSFPHQPVIVGRGDARFPRGVRPFDGPQFTPDLFVMTLYWYDIYGTAHSQELAQVMATGNQGVYIGANRLNDYTEYWYVNEQVLANVGGSGSSIGFNYTQLHGPLSYTPPTYSQRQAFQLDEVPATGWQLNQDPYMLSGSSFYQGTTTDGVTTYLQLVSGNASGITTLKDVAWFVSTNPGNGLITPAGSFAFSSAPSNPHAYYAVKQQVP